MKESGIYVHIPFCRKKCIYCDFFSGSANGVDWNLFVSSIIGELKERFFELETVPSTLYIGGGTPSLIPDREFCRLIENITTCLGKQDIWREFTLEVNPEDVTSQRCEVWKSCGVTRISMGIQSLDDVELKIIGRNHGRETALTALSTLMSFFDNVTIDLIFGLPGQTIASWRNSVDSVLKYSPAHISAYSLMFEEGTVISVLRDQGRLKFPDENECLKMWQYLSTELRTHGYIQYEISNYAKPARESVHNKRYWQGNPYLGLGPGAHSYDGNCSRRSNPCKIKDYINRFGNEGLNTEKKRIFYIEEILTREELIEEKIMLSMRMSSGLNLMEFKESFGENAFNRVIKNSQDLISRGVLIKENHCLKLASEAIMLADEVILTMCL